MTREENKQQDQQPEEDYVEGCHEKITWYRMYVQ